MITRVIPATNVQSSELVKILRPLVPQYSHVASVDNPNVVILSDHAENIRRMEAIIREIDVADDEQVVVVPLAEAYVDNMVALLEQLAPEQIGGSAPAPGRSGRRQHAQQLPRPARQGRARRAPARAHRDARHARVEHRRDARVPPAPQRRGEEVATILEGMLTQQTGDRDAGPDDDPSRTRR